VEDARALPEPKGNMPRGILMEASQSDLFMVPFTSYIHREQKHHEISSPLREWWHVLSVTETKICRTPSLISYPYTARFM